MLASRGAGPEFFERAAPDFIDTVRTALFVEAAMPFLKHWRQVEAAESDPKHPDLDLIKAKSQARDLVPLLEDLLYPEDDDA